VTSVIDPAALEIWPVPAASHSRRGLALVPGLLACAAIAAVATAAGRLVPVVGAPVCGIVLGVGIGVVVRKRGLDAPLKPGVAFAGRAVLQLAIVVLGTGLSLAQVAQTGWSSLPVLLGTLALALLAAWGFGHLLGIDDDLRTLIGVGTGICGASAIAATTAVIGAAEADVAYAISTIFAFNVIAVLAYPTLGHLLGLSQHAFGLWSGTAINDTSSVIAAAYTYGHAAGDYAVVVKLTRTLMIIPITIALSVMTSRRATRAVARVQVESLLHTTDGASGATLAEATDGVAGVGSSSAVAGAGRAGRPVRRLRIWQLVPWFLVGFLVAAALNSLGAVPHGAHSLLSTLSLFLITMALSGIGLATRPMALRSAGLRPLALGAILWATVGISSLLLQAATGMH
jgi:uncharacterized integral membrane protein (TIGR00698 family)